jgi:hypothetical protein
MCGFAGCWTTQSSGVTNPDLGIGDLMVSRPMAPSHRRTVKSAFASLDVPYNLVEAVTRT